MRLFQRAWRPEARPTKAKGCRWSFHRVFESPEVAEAVHGVDDSEAVFPGDYVALNFAGLEAVCDFVCFVLVAAADDGFVDAPGFFGDGDEHGAAFPPVGAEMNVSFGAKDARVLVGSGLNGGEEAGECAVWVAKDESGLLIDAGGSNDGFTADFSGFSENHGGE